MKELKYLWIALPILIFSWVVVLNEAYNGDYVSVTDFIILGSILMVATAWIGIDIFKKLNN